jgi:hypothetical protein
MSLCVVSQTTTDACSQKHDLLCHYYRQATCASAAERKDMRDTLENFLQKMLPSDMSMEASVLAYFMTCLCRLVSLVNDHVSHDLYLSAIQSFLFMEYDYRRYNQILKGVFTNKLEKLRFLIMTAEEDLVYRQCHEVMQILQKDFLVHHSTPVILLQQQQQIVV